MRSRCCVITLTTELDWIGRDCFMKKVLYLSLGLFLTCLGIIGAFLPVMPTTVFLIGALFCFTKSSPRLESWLIQHPKYGPSLVAWRKHGAISKKVKCIACCSMLISFILSILPLHDMVLMQPSCWKYSRPQKRRSRVLMPFTSS